MIMLTQASSFITAGGVAAAPRVAEAADWRLLLLL
jgi:hypothetical protein